MNDSISYALCVSTERYVLEQGQDTTNSDLQYKFGFKYDQYRSVFTELTE